MILLMFDELNCFIDNIIKASQEQKFEQAESLLCLLKEKNILKKNKKIDIEKAELLYSKIQLAVGIIKTQKALLLDELTLLQNGKKALSIYNI